MSTMDELKEELNKYTSFYWSLFNKTKGDCIYYKDIIHDKDLEIMKLKRELGTFKVNIYHGKISSVSPDNTFGLIECHDFENKIRFHKTNCMDFILKKVQMIDKEVTFNLDFIYGKFQAINIKNNDTNDNPKDLYNIMDDFMDAPDMFDNIKYTIEDDGCDEKEYKINPLFINCDVWYMNGYNTHDMEQSLSIWEHLIDNGFVYTWCGKGSWRYNNKTNVNTKLSEKLNIGDKIAWYFPQKGYSSILEVKGDPHLAGDDELSVIKSCFKENTIDEIKESFQKWSWNIIIIPVKFLAHTNKNNCIGRGHIKWNKDYEWAYGFRGSSAIKPTSPYWLEQVSKMYDHMKKT